MKFDRLNLLRIYAFLMIFLLHSKIFIPVEWYENVSVSWILFTPAWAGVWIFFILSGYGIGYGFYSEKYKLTPTGIIQYYYSRLIKVIPIYWLCIFIITIFLKPEYLLIEKNTICKMLKLLLFNYQAEFDTIEYGLMWYMTTLMRLYLVAPLFFLLKKRYLNLKSHLGIWFLLLVVGG